MKTLLVCILAMAFLLAGCKEKETIIEYRSYPSQALLRPSDAFHGHIVGKVKQVQSNALVIASQVAPVESTFVDPDDGSFALQDLQMGNYDLTIQADNYRVYQQTNVIVEGGGINYIGEIDLSTIPDLVSSVYPENNSEVVYDWRYGRITISILFTRPMDRESVEKAFSTSPPSTGIFYWGMYAQSPRSTLYETKDAASGYSNGAVITTYSKITSVTYSMSQSDAMVDTMFTITLSTGAKDTAGNHLRFPLVSSFRTVQSYVTYSGIQTIPANGDIYVTPLNSSGITVTFPRRMDPLSTEAATYITPPMNKTILWPSENVMTVYTGGPYLSDTTITVSIDGSAKDKDGIALGEAFIFWFRTAPLQVTSNTPTNAQLYVATNQYITLTFNSYVDRSTVQAAFSITPGVSGTFVYGSGYSYSDDPSQVTFVPSSALQPNTKYTVEVKSSVRDLYGVPMKTGCTFSFMTRPN
jgi:hypothetical protein